MTHMFTRLCFTATLSTCLLTVPAIGQPTQTPKPLISGFAVAADSNSYADVADLVVASPLIIDATVKKATPLPATQSVGVPAGVQRMLVQADVMALLRGTDGVTGTVKFLLDVPKNAKGKVPKLKKRRYFLLGQKVAGQPGAIRLSRPDSLIEWSVPNDARVRAITKEAVQLDAPQAVISVTSAFHSAGTVIGEGDTQIFLTATGGQPYSITVTNRDGKAKSWSVSTSELIEEGAGAPQRNTLLWYRLACGMPSTLDAKLVESVEDGSVARAQVDYRFVIDSLGRCDRTRK